MQSKWVRVGSVRRFDLVSTFKPQALKPLEEATGEAVGARQGLARPRVRPVRGVRRKGALRRGDRERGK